MTMAESKRPKTLRRQNLFDDIIARSLLAFLAGRAGLFDSAGASTSLKGE
jgi:hypothetical protein